jgi:hypothetical protein
LITEAKLISDQPLVSVIFHDCPGLATGQAIRKGSEIMITVRDVTNMVALSMGIVRTAPRDIRPVVTRK